jgi:6-phosphogluconolactonase
MISVRPKPRIDMPLMSVPTHPILYSFPTTSDLSDSLADYIIKAQRESIEKRGRFSVAISGGSLPKTLTSLITKPGVKWDKWRVHFLVSYMPPFIHSSPLFH